MAEIGDENWLLASINNAFQKLLTSNNQCLVCSRPVTVVTLKPTVCSRPVCKLGYEELGLGFDLRSELNWNADVVDLLLALAFSAVKVCIISSGHIFYFTVFGLRMMLCILWHLCVFLPK